MSPERHQDAMTSRVYLGERGVGHVLPGERRRLAGQVARLRQVDPGRRQRRHAHAVTHHEDNVSRWFVELSDAPNRLKRNILIGSSCNVLMWRHFCQV